MKQMSQLYKSENILRSSEYKQKGTYSSSVKGEDEYSLQGNVVCLGNFDDQPLNMAMYTEDMGQAHITDVEGVYQGYDGGDNQYYS